MRARQLRHLLLCGSTLLALAIPGQPVRGGIDYPDPEGGWMYTYTGDGAAPDLDGTWRHDNGSDEWDETGIGAGSPGGASSIEGYLRIQDTGDPRSHGSSDPGSNRKIYFGHSITDTLGAVADDILDTGVTLSFRTRVATSGLLDDAHPAGGLIDPWPAGGNGYVIHDGGKGNFGIKQAAGGVISFSLSTANEDSAAIQPGAGLVMNSLNGTAPSGDVDQQGADGGTLNVYPGNVTQWQEYWITIQGGGTGTHVVNVWSNGGLAPSTFDVTAGSGSDFPDSYIAMGAGSTPQSGAFDVDFFSYTPGIVSPPGAELPVSPVAGGSIGIGLIEGAIDPIYGDYPLANPVEGLTHRWYVGNSNSFAAAQSRIVNDTPIAGGPFEPDNAVSQWWYGSSGTQPFVTLRYPFEVEDAGALTVEGNESFANYTAVLTGQINIPEAGLYRFKDGVDDYASLRIDLNGNGTFEPEEHLINDNAWTGVAGNENGGSPIVEVNIDVPSGGSWLDFEFIMSEGGGGDAGILAWDYDPLAPAGSRLGGGVAQGFPTAQDQAFGAELALNPADALDEILIPDTHLRTQGIRPILGGTVEAALQSGIRHQVQAYNRFHHDVIGVSNPDADRFETTLDISGALIEIVDAEGFLNGDTIKIIDADAIVGDDFTLQSTVTGHVWDTTNLLSTGEITLVEGGLSVGVGNKGDFDDDGDVDAVDLGEFLGVWTGSLDAGNAEDDPARPNLLYDPATGNVTLVPAEGGKLIGFTIGNADAECLIRPPVDLNAILPWPVVLTDPGRRTCTIGSSDLSFVGTEEPIALGPIFPHGMDVGALQEFLSLANALTALGAAGRSTFDLVVVPEPGSFVLLSLGLVGLLIRRR